MKPPRFLCRIAMVLAGAGLLSSGGARADPSPTPHKKKHAAAHHDDDSGDATPGPSPSPQHRTHHAEDDGSQPGPTAPPASKSGGGFHKSPDEEDGHAKTGKSAEGGAKPESHDDGAKDEASPMSTTKQGAGKSAPAAAATSTIDTSELRDFESQPEPVRNLLNSALDLTRRNLTYAYGSADPASGGMDCSGTIFYLLKNAGFDDVPRSASEQYAWVRQKSSFYAVLSKKEDSFELKELRPGDLLFWTGTYHVDRDPPVTHAMIYLGKRKKDGKPLMMGASDGRPYDGEKRNGVSVFDFTMPAARNADSTDAATAAAPDHAPDFVGYGPVPGMAERNDAATRQAAALRSPAGSKSRQ